MTTKSETSDPILVLKLNKDLSPFLRVEWNFISDSYNFHVFWNLTILADMMLTRGTSFLTNENNNRTEYNFMVSQFSHSVMSDSLQPRGLKHTWPPCPSPTPGAHSSSCPSSWWCHLTTSSSVIPSVFNISQHQGLFQGAVLHIGWLKCWTFSFSINPFKEYSGLISFRIYWFDLLVVQGTL